MFGRGDRGQNRIILRTPMDPELVVGKHWNKASLGIAVNLQEKFTSVKKL